MKRVAGYVVAGLIGVTPVLADKALSADAITLARIPHIHAIAVDPADKKRLILGTRKGLYRVTPDQALEPLLDGKHEVTGLAVSADGRRLIVSGSKSRKGFGALQSGDGGKTWKPAGEDNSASLSLRLLAQESGKLERLFAVGKSLHFSADGGRNWQDVGPPPAATLGLKVLDASAKNLLAATAKGLKESTDGGKSWKSVDAGPKNRPASMAGRAGSGSAYAFIVGGGLYARPEPGAKWRKLTGAKAFDGALIHLTGQPNRLVAVTQYMKILISRDGGKKWTRYGR